MYKLTQRRAHSKLLFFDKGDGRVGRAQVIHRSSFYVRHERMHGHRADLEGQIGDLSGKELVEVVRHAAAELQESVLHNSTRELLA